VASTNGLYGEGLHSGFGVAALDYPSLFTL
jgi:hypothetical protein